MALGSIGEVSYDIISRDKTAEGLTSAGDRARQIGKVAGAAITGIGVGMIALTDSAKKTNATIRQTALQLGVSAKEMRELTLATTNVTFPIEEVTASFDLLTRAGMENKDEIATTASTFDMLGDAIGKTASEVTGPMVTAMKTFGLEISEGADYTDKMTYLLRNTTLEMDNFSSIIAKIPPDIVEMGLTMDDTIALLGLMEESGLSGAVATREFEKAVTAARKTGEPLNEVLGITSKQMDKYKKKLEGAEGMTLKYAKAANTQYGTMDKIKQSISTLTLKYGSMLEPLDALGPAMATLGPIMIMMSSIQWGTLIPALIAHAAAAWASIAPYLLIIAPIVAVIAILYILEKKFGLVTKALKVLKDIAGKVMGFFKKLRDTFLGIKDVTEDMTDASNKLGKAEAKLIKLEEDLTDARKAEERATRDVENTTKKLEDAQKAVAATAKEIDELTTAYEDLLDIEKDVLDITEDIDDQHRAVEHAMWDLKDAQDDYNDAVEEYGENSDEAAKANLRLRDAQDRYDDSLKRVEDSEQKLIDKNNEKTDVLKENNATSLQDLENTLEAKQEAAEPAFENIRNLELDLEGKVEIQRQREADVGHLEGTLDSKKKDIEDYTGEVERIEEESGKKRLNIAEKLYGGMRKVIDRFGDKLLLLLGPIGAVVYAFRNWRDILDIVKGKLNSVISYIGGLYSTFHRLGRNLIQWFISGVTGILWKIKYAIGDKLSETYYRVKDWFSSYYNLGKALIQSFINGFTSKIWALKDEITRLLWWIYNRLPHSPVKMGPLVEEPDWESYLVEPMRTAKISPGVMFESGIGGGVGTSKPTIEVKVEATIYNYSDVEEMERMVAEATARGIHDAYGMR